MGVAAWWSSSPDDPSSAPAEVVGEHDRILIRNGSVRATILPAFGATATYTFLSVASAEGPTGERASDPRRGDALSRPTGRVGTLLDVGFEADRYAVADLQSGPDYAFAELVDDEPSSALRGARKGFLAPSLFDVLAICYQLPEAVHGIVVTIQEPSDRARPDLMELPDGEEDDGGSAARAGGGSRAWVARASDEGPLWMPAPSQPHPARDRYLMAPVRHFHLLLGRGERDDARTQRLMRWGRDAIHEGIRTSGKDAQHRGGTWRVKLGE